MNSDRLKIGLVSADNVGEKMAGAGIRYFELAKALEKHFDVTLCIPNNPDGYLRKQNLSVNNYFKSAKSSQIDNLKRFDIVISQNLTPNILKYIKKNKIIYIADLYDPLPIETVEHTRFSPLVKRIPERMFAKNYFFLQMIAADHILCSNDRQKYIYINYYESLGRKIEEKDITLLPFGFSDDNPICSRTNIFTALFPKISPDDKIILWNGGIWNWFDPLTVIKAIEKISMKRSDVKLVFMGGNNNSFKDLQDHRISEIMSYCQNHKLLNEGVFFNKTWLPYSERTNFLLSSNICISTHFECQETYYSFRTRILDALWARKPIVLTEGDYFAKLVKKNNIGRVVRYQNVTDIENAILEIIDNTESKEDIIRNIEKIRSSFSWQTVTKKLVDVIQSNNIQSQRLNYKLFNRLERKYLLWGGIKKIINKIV